MATLYTVLGQDAHATRGEIFQHLCSSEFFALAAMNRWFYRNPDVVAIKVLYSSDIARRLILLVEKLQYCTPTMPASLLASSLAGLAAAPEWRRMRLQDRLFTLRCVCGRGPP